MDTKQIEIYIHEYIDKLTKEIIDECVLRKMINTTDLPKAFRILLDSKDNSLLKRQIQFSNKQIASKVVRDGNKLKINIEDAVQEFTFSTFHQLSILFEKIINRHNLDEENNAKKYNLNQEKAAKLLTKNIDSMSLLILDEIKKSNVEKLLLTFYSIAGILSLVSGITTIKTKFEIKEKLWEADNKDDSISLLLNTVQNLNIEEMKKVSYIVGEHKYACDMLFNIVYKMYLCNDDKDDNSHKSFDISSLFAKVMVLNKMKLFRQSNALLYERGDFISIEDFILNQKGNLANKFMQFFEETIRFNYNESLINGVFDKYKKYEGFSPDNLSELNEGLMKHFQMSDKKVIAKINICSVENFKNYIKNVCNITEKGIDTFFSALCLEVNSDLFNMSNKISRTPLVLTKDYRVITMIPLLLQAEQTLGVRMLEQNFTKNVQVKKYIRKHYNEDLIDELIDIFTKKRIQVWKSVHLASVKNKKIRSLFISGITEEIDIAYFRDGVLYFVEYKAWMTGASNIKAFLSEYNVKKHYKAMRVVKNYIDDYTEIFGQNIKKIHDIKLIMVFQNPTAFNYLNEDKNVRGSSFQEFKKIIENY
ncbi:hypothetical protein [Clostridium botulinum]|uniref:hypothetical protein n=1 Tax=Clostridium botulinum TaxID=1491 RepID=UPI002491877D|nr:hypothetical protein [Clostridium botulinum]BDB03636.1 hypothetical protein CBOS2020_37100 [Clostridium botulinum]